MRDIPNSKLLIAKELWEHRHYGGEVQTNEVVLADWQDWLEKKFKEYIMLIKKNKLINEASASYHEEDLFSE